MATQILLKFLRWNYTSLHGKCTLWHHRLACIFQLPASSRLLVGPLQKKKKIHKIYEKLSKIIWVLGLAKLLSILVIIYHPLRASFFHSRLFWIHMLASSYSNVMSTKLVYLLNYPINVQIYVALTYFTFTPFTEVERGVRDSI